MGASIMLQGGKLLLEAGLGVIAEMLISKSVDVVSTADVNVEEIIASQQTGWDRFIASMKETSEVINGKIKGAQANLDSIDEKTEEVKNDNTELKSLNTQERIKGVDKYRVNEIVGKWESLIPDMNGIFDSQTGRFTVTNDEIDRMFANWEKEFKQNKLLESQASSIEALALARKNYGEATEAVADAEEELTKVIGENKTLPVEMMGMAPQDIVDAKTAVLEAEDIQKTSKEQYLEALKQVIQEAAALKELEGNADTVADVSDKIVESCEEVSTKIAETTGEQGLAYEPLNEMLEEEVQNIQDYGIKLPELFSEGIEDGADSPVEALKQLNDSLQEVMDEQGENGQEFGLQFTDNLAEGFEDNQSSTVKTFLKGMSGLEDGIGDVLDSIVSVAQEKGIQIPDDIAAGIEAGGIAALSAYAYLLNEIAAQSNEAQLAGTETGNSVTDGCQSGMIDGKTQVTEAGAELMTAVKNTMASTGGFYGVGVNIAASVALGIRDGQSRAIAASVAMANAAHGAARKELVMNSPSKKFFNIGQNISESTAFGINDKASLAGRAAARMSSKVYSRAVSWLAKYKKKQQVSLKDEKYYWEEVVKHTKKGTNAYNKAMEKVKKYTSLTNLTSKGITADAAEEILDNFGVSKTTGKGKSKKKKDTETYYSDIYSAAEKYLSNRKIIEGWSLEQELAYWTAIEKRLKDGTQAWYDAKEKISDLQNDITEAEAKAAEQKLKTHVNVQDDILDAYKVYYNLSAKAEAEYWDIARQQFTEGTEERIQADENYMKALEDWYDERKKLDEDYAENSKDINDQLIEDIQDLQEAYTDAVKSRKEDILSSMNLFDSWDTEGYDGETLIYNLKTQVAGLELWEQQLEELSKKGLSEDLMESLTEMGPDAAANIYSLNQMTPEQLAEYNQLWLQKSALAEAQAIKENESLRLETNEEIAQLRLDAQAELDALYADYKASLQELETGLSRGLKDLIDQAGSLEEENVASLVTGLGKAAKSVEAYNSTLKQLNQAASQLSDMGAVTVPDYSGVMKLNQMTELYASPTSVINVDNTGMIQAVQQMMTGMESMLERMENLQVVMDTGAMVGVLQPAISQESAAVTVRKNRGRL